MGRRVPGYSWESAGRPPVAGAFQAAPGCSGACSVAPGFLLNGSAPKMSRRCPPALAPVGTVPPPAEEAEARAPESAGGAGTAPGALQIPGPARGSVPGSEQDPAPTADRYCWAVPASAGSASGSSPRPVPAEAASAEAASADWIPADSSPGSAAAVAIPAA